MIDQLTNPFIGAILLAALLAAVMGTAASVTMLTAVTVSRDVIGRIKKDMTDRQMLTTQRVLMVVVAALGLVVGYFGSSIVAIMEEVGAPCGAALVPIFCGLFFWGKKMNAKGCLITIAVAVASTLIYWAAGSPLGISHFLFGLACSTITMFIANSICYKPNRLPGVSELKFGKKVLYGHHRLYHHRHRLRPRHCRVLQHDPGDDQGRLTACRM